MLLTEAYFADNTLRYPAGITLLNHRMRPLVIPGECSPGRATSDEDPAEEESRHTLFQQSSAIHFPDWRAFFALTFLQNNERSYAEPKRLVRIALRRRQFLGRLWTLRRRHFLGRLRTRRGRLHWQRALRRQRILSW